MTQCRRSIDEVIPDLSTIKFEDFANNGDRNKALLATYALASRLETPWETAHKQGVKEDVQYLAEMLSARNRSLFQSPHAAAKHDGPILVDVGGSLGHDTNKFLSKYPDLAFRCYIQDLPNVVADPKAPDALHNMAHNFLTPQPVHGAMVYYLHAILHDWSDETARMIPQCLDRALKKRYNRVLGLAKWEPGTDGDIESLASPSQLTAMFHRPPCANNSEPRGTSVGAYAPQLIRLHPHLSRPELVRAACMYQLLHLKPCCGNTYPNGRGKSHSRYHVEDDPKISTAVEMSHCPSDALIEPKTAMDMLPAWSPLTTIVVAWVVFYVVQMLYNVSPLHPLSHIPGPKLAAATWLYEIWFDLVLGGTYTQRIKRMHEEYGPVVRINPEELHFNDIAFVDEIYAGAGRKRDKQPHYLNFFSGSVATSTIATSGHDLHRIRRAALNKYFSRAQISNLESGIKDLAEALCEKMIRLGTRDNKPFDLKTAYSCFTADVISKYCFGEPFGFVGQAEWEPNFRKALLGGQGPVHLFRAFPFVRALTNVAQLFPTWASPDLREMLTEANERMPARIQKARKEYNTGVSNVKPSIFGAILASNLPEVEKSDWRLGGEGFNVIAAGTDTTSWALTVVTFYLLSQRETLDRLQRELEGADAVNLSWIALEKLPYLNAVVLEGLRLSHGLGARLARGAPTETLVYQGEYKGRRLQYSIPRGTPCGMSNAINHYNEEAFPDPYAFSPERWLGVNEAQRRRMDASLTAFSRGSRQCLGINLAYCNLYRALAALALRVFPRMELYETTVADVQYDYDLFLPMVKRGSQGVRVTIS
ncbi:uncharacterized protein DSM5745_06812 [Aspergillus mulundensis]|uniref:O-methyltransferase C-terminal domain-containing protein n=1 Tax=Aspergillus mulundensis TaxID=1810919 RepID=A0A3D8RS82_9EURO|nr:hypothetical protein DSM5745_06812 [Aspergillus mulundensis]RDW76820.1 hypothetical protein DSM5745_06812 [Aspergillus mulundensis]